MFPTRRPDLRRQDTKVNDRAFDIGDPNVIADAQRARVGDHEAAHHLIDEAARAERQHDAEEHTRALEGIGARSPGSMDMP